MRTLRLLVVLFLLIGSAALVTGLSSQDLNRITMVNETGRTLVKVFVSPRDSRQWGPDLLLRKKLDYGAMRDYFVHYTGVRSTFDFLAFDDQDRSYLIESFPIKDGQPAVVAFSVRNALPTAPKLNLINVFVTNATNRTIAYLFFSPIDSNDWGFDILNNTTNLQPGGSIVFSVPVGAQNTVFEILALSKDQTMVQRRLKLSTTRGDVFLDFNLADLH